MADHAVPHFSNDAGVPAIRIGEREFMCVGASPPYDHPHVFLDMGGESEIGPRPVGGFRVRVRIPIGVVAGG